MTSRIDVLRSQLQQLQTRHAAGEIDEAALAAARQPLERELVDLVTAGAAPAPTAAAEPRPSRGLLAGLSAGVLALAVAGYALTGSPGSAGLTPAASQAAADAAAGGADAPVTEAQVVEVVERMAQRLKEQPDDAAGWALIARAYAALGRHAEAVPAFAKALELAGESAPLLVDYADTLAAQNGGQFSPQALQAVQRALVLEPGNIKGLALAGSAAFDRRDYATAVKLWELVERGLPPDSGILAQVRASIAQAREAGGLPPASAAVAAAPAASPAPRGEAAATAATAAAGDAAATSLSGTVSLAPAVAARASPEDTVFILARAAEGPRMPLAILRKQVKDLPFNFALDDGMAMAAGARISSFPRVVVVARVSKSGQAMPQPGDLSGQSAPVAPGATGLTVRIDEVVGP